MKKIALLISENILPYLGSGPHADAFEFDEQVKTLTTAFESQDMQLSYMVWENAAGQARGFDLIMPIMVWDYAEGKRSNFLKTMRIIAGKTQLLNPPNMLEWNSDKSYLARLAAKGAPIIPSLSLEAVTKQAVHAAFDQLGTDHIIIKPRIGAGAWRQVSLKRGESLPPAEQLPPDAALIQAFQSAVQTEGEYSLLYFDGEFSHAVLKRAKAGDYRIQSIYGGCEAAFNPAPDMLAVAEKVLSALGGVPLYARVDLLRAEDGALKLIELELIEPYLYLPHAKTGEDGKNQGAQKLAKAVKKRLSA